MTCLSSNSVAIVKTLLEHGANPNSEEGVPVKDSTASVPREEQDERPKSRDESSTNRVTFLIAAESNDDDELGAAVKNEEGAEVDSDTDEEDQLATAAPVPVLAGDNPGGLGCTPLHLICCTDANTHTEVAQELVR